MLKKRKDPTALVIAAVLHGVAIVVLFVWAAKTGKLDPLLKAFDVVLAPKDKKPEPKKEEPKVEPIKQEELPKLTPPPAAVAVAPPPSSGAAPPAAAPAVAPPPAALPSFDFSDGAKVVESSTNAPVIYYKGQVEFALRSNWERPPNIEDDTFVAEINLHLDPNGRILKYDWKKTSGDKRWDDSVAKAIAVTKTMPRPPPKGFPEEFLVRFDVLPATEPLVQ